MMRRVLVIDDDAHIREVVAVALADEGCEVLTAADGAMGLALAATKRPDLILLDVRMPGMDGAEFSRRYREQPGPHAPIVVLTAAYDSDTVAEDVQAASVLAKPFSMDELVTITRRYARRNG